MGLNEDRIFYRIDAACKVKRCEFKASPKQNSRILAGREGVKISQHEQTVMGFLQIDRALQCTDVIADGQVSGRLNSAEKDKFFIILEHILCS
jgi:hypothetical protein